MGIVTISGRSVVSDGAGRFSVADVEVDDPAAGEVVVEIGASGVCHTDHDLAGIPIPFVLGHEGAGTVTDVGDGVDDVAVGDRVLLTWAPSCRRCFQCVAGSHHLCERLSPFAPDLGGHAHRDGTRRDGVGVIRAFNLGTMSTHALVRREVLVPLPDDIPFTSACIVGCGVMTGFGSAASTP